MIKIVSLTILLICLVSSVCLGSEKLTDSRGYMRDGRIEEYDRRAREAGKTGFDKKGYYINPEYRRDLENRSDPDEYAKKDAARESLYFNADGTPKPGAFATDKEIEEMMDRYEKAKLEVALEHARQFGTLQDKQAAEKARKLRAQERKLEVIRFLFCLFVICIVGGFVIVCLMVLTQKMSEARAQKALDKYDSEETRKLINQIDFNIYVKYDASTKRYYVYDNRGNIYYFFSRKAAECFVLELFMGKVT